MLVLSFFRSVVFVQSDADFEAISGKESVYLVSDVNFELPAPVDVKNCVLDCVGRQITGRAQIFGRLEASMIRNCTFKLDQQLAALIDQTTLTNVTIITTAANKFRTMIGSSYFYGVRIEAASQFAGMASDTLFVGCAIHALINKPDNELAFVEDMWNCTFQNCFVDATINANNATLVAGLAIKASDLLVLNSRFITNISAFSESNGLQARSLLGGLAGKVEKTLTVRNCDFVTKMLISGQFGSVAGVVAVVSSNEAVILHNASSYFMLSDNASGGYGCVGNVAGNVTAGSVTAENVSTFNNVQLSNADQQLPMRGFTVLAGIIAEITVLREQSTILQCCVFGSLGAKVKSNSYVYVGGCVGRFQLTNEAQFELNQVAISSEIDFALLGASNSQLKLGGLVGEVGTSELVHSSFHGNITVNANQLGTLSVSATVTNENQNVQLHFCAVFANTSIMVKDISGNVNVGFFVQSGKLMNNVARGNLTIAESGDRATQIIAGGLASTQRDTVENCSVDINLVLKTTRLQPMQGLIGGLVGDSFSVSSMNFNNVLVRGTITAPEGTKNIGTMFGRLSQIDAANIVVAVDVIMAGASAKAFPSNDSSTVVFTNLFIDCNRKGNDASQEYCRANLASESAATELGAAFAWNARYNGGYPYPNMLPVPDAGSRYVLPDSGNFSAPAYYIDDAGSPFPATNFQPCRGVCYGTYGSPATRTCDDAFEYCLDVDRAVREFPGDSCITDNAVCSSGASFCSSEAEMLLLADTSERACQKACSGCQNGRCSQAKCICDIYNSENTCTPKCDADEPYCFGNNLLVCDISNTECIFPPSCDSMKCNHGSCIDLPIAHCECDGLWAGDDCGSCKDGFDPAVDCEKCKGAMEVIDGDCACGKTGIVCEDSYFCSSGSCQKNCMLLDRNCTSCNQNQLDLCGSCIDGLVLKNGLCVPPKKIPAAAIAGGVAGGLVAIVAVGITVFVVLKRSKKKQKKPPKDDQKPSDRKPHQLTTVQPAVGDQSQLMDGQQHNYTTGESAISGKPAQ